jgi:hypothetical protein
MAMFSNKKNSKKLIEYKCEICHFNTCNKNDYSRHLLTKKHLSNIPQTNLLKKTQNKSHDCVCGKTYCDYSGLWRHKKICSQINQPEINIIEDKEQTDKVEELTEIIKCLVKDNSEIKNLVMIQQNTITDLVKNGTHNTTINLPE